MTFFGRKYFTAGYWNRFFGPSRVTVQSDLAVGWRLGEPAVVRPPQLVGDGPFAYARNIPRPRRITSDLSLAWEVRAAIHSDLAVSWETRAVASAEVRALWTIKPFDPLELNLPVLLAEMDEDAALVRDSWLRRL